VELPSLHNVWDDPKYAALKRDLLVELLRRTVQADDRLPIKTAHV